MNKKIIKTKRTAKPRKFTIVIKLVYVFDILKQNKLYKHKCCYVDVCGTAEDRNVILKKLLMSNKYKKVAIYKCNNKMGLQKLPNIYEIIHTFKNSIDGHM